MKTENLMNNVRLEKVTLNVGCGPDKEKIERAEKLLELLTKRKPVVTVSKTRSTFGVPKGNPLGAMITLRKQPAAEFLKRAFYALENKLKESQIDKSGNFSFGIHEYIDIQGIKYSHDVGLLGLDVAVSLEKPGYRVKKRKVKTDRLGKRKAITKEEVAEWLKNNFGVQLV
ncbi:MAG TPA: 50S ribosomal protein L5 [archaeon]|nr:50S ribosomal protein L5 [archaeon]